MKHIYFITLVFVFFISCGEQSHNSSEKTEVSPMYGTYPDLYVQVSQYIRRMFQDKKGNLWFGTNSDGVCRYNGKVLKYFNEKNGFAGSAVRGFAEDKRGDLWIATDAGICRYNGKKFETFGKANGIESDECWCILIDTSGTVWCGTELGVFRYDGRANEAGDTLFEYFPIPAADLKKTPDAYAAPKLINCIYQDKAGRIWFGSNGNGIYVYSGIKLANGDPILTNFSEKDGLCNNFVQCMIEDTHGKMWFGSRFGGMSSCDGKSFKNYSLKEGLSTKFVWTFLTDPNGHLWIGTAGGGLCKFDGSNFSVFSLKEGLPNRHVQSLMIDKRGRFWIGTSGGLFHYDERSFINVTKNGPWEKY